MGPHGVGLTVISGQENSGELVIAASVFLEMHYLSITPVSKSKRVREEFLLALDIFSYRTYAYYSSSAEQRFIQKLTEPNDRLATTSLFWLALDREGYSMAREAFAANGLFPDETIYQSIRKLNQIEQEVPPFPASEPSSETWLQIQREMYQVAWEHRRVRSTKGRQKLFNQHVPMSSAERECHSWFQALNESLMPWKQAIYNIQSDWS